MFVILPTECVKLLTITSCEMHKLGWPTIACEFDFQWVPESSSLVSNWVKLDDARKCEKDRLMFRHLIFKEHFWKSSSENAYGDLLS